MGAHERLGSLAAVVDAYGRGGPAFVGALDQPADRSAAVLVRDKSSVRPSGSDRSVGGAASSARRNVAQVVVAGADRSSRTVPFAALAVTADCDAAARLQGARINRQRDL